MAVIPGVLFISPEAMPAMIRLLDYMGLDVAPASQSSPDWVVTKKPEMEFHSKEFVDRINRMNEERT